MQWSWRSFYCTQSNYFTLCSLLLRLTNMPVCFFFYTTMGTQYNIYKCSRNDRRPKHPISSCNTASPCIQFWAPLALKNSTLWAYYSHTGPIVCELYKTSAWDPLKCSPSCCSWFPANGEHALKCAALRCASLALSCFSINRIISQENTGEWPALMTHLRA